MKMDKTRSVRKNFLSKSDATLAEIEKWDFRFLSLANTISSWSKDPSTRVGAVIVDDLRRIVSVGYNGLPRGLKDSQNFLGDRELKYKVILHAEENAILEAERDRLFGATIYLYPFLPCSHCASRLIQAGVKRVVSIVNTNPRWVESINLGRQLLETAGINVKEY